MDDAADSCGVEGVDPEGEAVDSPVDLQSNLLYTWCCELWVVTSELHCGYRQRKSFPLVVVFSLSQGEELSLLLCFQRSQLKWFVPLIRKPSGRMSLKLFHCFQVHLGSLPQGRSRTCYRYYMASFSCRLAQVALQADRWIASWVVMADWGIRSWYWTDF